MAPNAAVSAGTPVGTAASFRRPLTAAAATLAATAVVVAVNPQRTHIPLCPFHALTGEQCPFCGSLRAVNALARGHLVAALHDNLILVGAAPVAVVLWLAWLRRTSTGEAPKPRPRWVAALGFVAVITYGVVRNLPGMDALRPA